MSLLLPAPSSPFRVLVSRLPPVAPLLINPPSSPIWNITSHPALYSIACSSTFLIREAHLGIGYVCLVGLRDAFGIAQGLAKRSLTQRPSRGNPRPCQQKHNN
eukprot:3395106-Pyramimonas_sp.AAC.1